jgi:hypothetical protein
MLAGQLLSWVRLLSEFWSRTATRANQSTTDIMRLLTSHVGIG